MLPFIPSPVEFEYDVIFRSIANKSGRMQYYRINKGHHRHRISKNEFSIVFNEFKIIAIMPIQSNSPLAPIQMDLFVKMN